MSLLKDLCSPSSVALIGVSRKTGKGALNPLQVLLEFGYKGKIYPVNPSAKEILGHKCYEKIQDIPDIPALAVIMVRRELVPQVLKDCAEKGIKTAIIISDGFAEADEKGILLQQELVKIHKDTGIRILGQNSMGVVNHFSSFTTSFVRVSKKVAKVAFVGQSGLFVQGFSQLRIGKSIDIGNGCDIGFAELLSDLLKDPEIETIVLHIEELKDPGSLYKVIREEGLRKHVVVFKSGRSEKAKKAIMSHSGSIAGDYLFYKAFLSRLGFLFVESTEELEDVVYLLSKIEIPKGRKVGIITPSGGAGIICLDALEENSFTLAKLSKDSLNRIKDIYPEYYQPSNPLDIMSASFRHGYRKVYTEALITMMEDNGVDIVFCINGMPTLKTIGNVVKEQNSKKPVISWIIGDYRQEEVESLTEGVQVAVFPNPERAFRSIKLCMDNDSIKKLNTEAPDFIDIKDEDLKEIDKILNNAKAKNRTYIFYEAFEIIKRLSIKIPNTLIIKDLDFDAFSIFEKLKPPVCIKIDSEKGIHKKREGLIRLFINNANELEDFIKEVVSRINPSEIRAAVLQEMVLDGIEVFIGVKRDEKFGHIMMIGKGGGDVEIYKDIETLMIPFNKAQALYHLKKTKISKILDDNSLDKILDVMLSVSTFCFKFPMIKEMDLNPIIVNQHGIWAVDVKIFLY